MKHKLLYILAITFTASMVTGCKKYLDINSDPDTTQEPSNSSVLPQCIAAIATGLQSDGGLYVAKYVQNWLTSASTSTSILYDQQGYSWSGGTMAATWQMTYYALGNNLNYMIENGLKKGEYEFVGVGYALKAWSFQHTTDYNSDIIFSEAFKKDQFTFAYDDQQTVYKGVDSLCRLALHYFDTIPDLTLATKKLAVGDLVYGGSVASWQKFVYGILARNWHHLSNKSWYNADSVISYCNKAMATVNDDFDIPFDATNNNNSNYFGTFRDNASTWRPSNFVVKLLDGTILSGSNAPANRDPRLSYLLTASQDTTNGNGGYRGIDIAQGDPNITLTGTYAVGSTNWINARKRVAVFWGDSMYTNPSAAVTNNSTGRFLFHNKAVFPIMTYAEMQFIKAEASLRKQDNAGAYTAFINGINGHFDFINRSYSGVRSSPTLYTNAPISATARSRYLTSPNVPQSAGTLTISDVMLQKYIALWGWGFFETWVDLRRFHYTDIDDVTGTGLQVYKGFTLPQPFYSSNLGKPVYRVRPHFTSEYTYNIDELRRLGVITQDYHTKEMWFSQKQ
jgi:hypothetical protein